jgi:hypothetical protein
LLCAAAEPNAELVDESAETAEVKFDRELPTHKQGQKGGVPKTEGRKNIWRKEDKINKKCQKQINKKMKYIKLYMKENEQRKEKKNLYNNFNFFF